MEMSSPYAHGSSVPPNIMGLSVETLTITYCTGRRANAQAWPLFQWQGAACWACCGRAQARQPGEQCARLAADHASLVSAACLPWPLPSAPKPQPACSTACLVQPVRAHGRRRVQPGRVGLSTMHCSASSTSGRPWTSPPRACQWPWTPPLRGRLPAVTTTRGRLALQHSAAGCGKASALCDGELPHCCGPQSRNLACGDGRRGCRMMAGPLPCSAQAKHGASAARCW